MHIEHGRLKIINGQTLKMMRQKKRIIMAMRIILIIEVVVGLLLKTISVIFWRILFMKDGIHMKIL